MSAFLLLLVAILSRVLPHAWLNFTAVGGSLLFFGARRPLKQVWIPVLALAATDFYLTRFVYAYPFHLQDYFVTWAWYAAVPVLGFFILSQKASALRIVFAALASSTSFFLVSNAMWSWRVSTIYPHNASGLAAAYVAAIPFYRNDVVSTLVVSLAAFGASAVYRSLSESRSKQVAAA